MAITTSSDQRRVVRRGTGPLSRRARCLPASNPDRQDDGFRPRQIPRASRGCLVADSPRWTPAQGGRGSHTAGCGTDDRDEGHRESVLDTSRRMPDARMRAVLRFAPSCRSSAACPRDGSWGRSSTAFLGPLRRQTGQAVSGGLSGTSSARPSRARVVPESSGPAWSPDRIHTYKARPNHCIWIGGQHGHR